MLGIRTLLLALALLTILSAVVSIAVHYKRFHVRGTAAGSWGFSLMAAGFLLFGMRGGMSLPVAVLLPNAVALSGFMLVCLGLHQFVHEHGPHRGKVAAWVATILAALAGASYVAHLHPNINVRISIIFLAVALMASDTALVLLRHARGRRAVQALGLFYSVFSLTCLAVAAYHSCWPDAGYFFAARSVSWFLFLGMAFGFIMIIGHIFMVGEELHVRLLEKNRILEENIRLRDEVDSITRHDLKTPIAPVVQALSFLLSSFDLPDGVRELVSKARRSALDALEMINRSLDVYKLEHGSYRLERKDVDLAEVLGRAAEDAYSPLAGKKLDVDISVNGRPLSANGGLMVRGEAALLYTMCANLLKNAFEASPAGEIVRVCLDGRNGAAVLRVENKGGMPPDIRKTLFQKFTTSGKLGGTGLGGYSARLAAEAHGGSVTMDTPAPEQVRVTVTLPVDGK